MIKTIPTKEPGEILRLDGHQPGDGAQLARPLPLRSERDPLPGRRIHAADAHEPGVGGAGHAGAEQQEVGGAARRDATDRVHGDELEGAGRPRVRAAAGRGRRDRDDRAEEPGPGPCGPSRLPAVHVAAAHMSMQPSKASLAASSIPYRSYIIIAIS